MNMTPTEMKVLLAASRCHAVPVYRDGESAPYGYDLKGPGGNKEFAAVDRDGNVSEFNIRLWLDCINYGDRRAAHRHG